MHLGKACRGDRKGFTNGTTNGAEWYYLTGKPPILFTFLGLQDFFLKTNSSDPDAGGSLSIIFFFFFFGK